MERHNHRLLMMLEQERRNINRDTINPQISDLSIEDLRPILTLIAEVRAAYIRSLIELAERHRDKNGDSDDCQLPDAEEIKKVAELGRSFRQLVNAANAMETAIERGYLDVESPKAA